MTHSEPTRVAANPSDSVLYTLARAAMGADVAPGEATWPRLDLDDPVQREFGDYELLEEIGRGGMGVVYRARQKSLEREVAIKFIAAGIEDSLNVSRFLSEARAAAKLMHPNIVPVHEVGSIDGLHYFSMPLVKGRTLATLLDAGPMTSADAAALMLKLCDAISYAHRLGLLHLDLKPSNVLIDERGEPLIADFGLARHMDDHGEVQAQEVSGTPAFMAPEQILIKQYRLTPATDIYALGAILYRALSGVSPHGEGKPDELTQRAVAGRVRPLLEVAPNAPRDLSAVAMHCLELLQSDRYHSVAALADDLRRVRDGLPVSVRHVGLLERTQRWFKREPKLAFASTAAALALLAGIGATSWQWREASAQRDAAEAARNDAVQKRDLAQGMAELGAWYYAEFERANAGAMQDGQGAMANTRNSRRMLEWLRTRYPGNDQQQARVLTAFAKAINQRDGSNDLLLPLIEILGKNYRDQMIAALIAGRQPNRYILAARLAWNTEQDITAQNGSQSPPGDAGPTSFTRLLHQAITAQPDNPDVWEVAAVHCVAGGSNCRPDAARNLTRLDPDNAYNWLLQMMGTEGTPARTALHEAAQRTLFDDRYRNGIAGYMEAVEKAHVPVPELLLGTVRVLSPHMAPERTIAEVETNNLPLAAWHPFQDRCDPAKHYFKDASAYVDCKATGVTMARSKSSLITRMIAAVVVRRLAKGSPLEQEMIELRRRASYVIEVAGKKLDACQIKDYPLRNFGADNMALGELAAWENQLAYCGFPIHPTKDWVPQNPCELELPEDRALCQAAHPSPAQATH